MRVLTDIEISLNLESVLRMQGLRDTSSVGIETFRRKVQELVAFAFDLSLLQPTIVYDLVSIVGIEPDRIVLEDGNALVGELPATRLRRAEEVAVVVCTIGPRLEAYVKESFDKSRRVEALLLDGIGSASVEHLAQKACEIIRDEADSRSLKAGSPLVPGISDFPLSEQHRLCQMVEAHKIGVCLTRTAMMKPRKSTALVVGLGKRMPRTTEERLCDECKLRATCRFQRSA